MSSFELKDFLYNDAQRINSFLAQFSARGLVNEVKEQINKGNSEKINQSRDAYLKVVGAGASGRFSNEEVESSGEAISLTYDPLWLNSIILQEFLEDRGALFRNTADAVSGQFITITGHLFMMDSKILKEVYGLKSWFPFILKDGAKILNDKAKSDENIAERLKNHTPKEIVQAESDLFSVLDPQLHAILVSEKGIFWSILGPEHLISSRDELTLKYGASTQGRWTIFGIKDTDPVPNTEAEARVLEKLIEYTGDNGFIKDTITFNTRIKNNMGRPAAVGSVTPLSIFRNINV